MTCQEAKSSLGNVGHHKFEARYDSSYPDGFFERLVNMSGNPKAYMEKVYVHDICIYCGEVIKAEK